jgi:hypothetical protein
MNNNEYSPGSSTPLRTPWLTWNLSPSGLDNVFRARAPTLNKMAAIYV